MTDTPIPFHRVAAQFFNRPLLLAPDAAQTIADFLAGRMRAGGGRGGNERSAESAEIFQPTRTEAGGAEVHSPRVSRFYGSTPLGADGRPLPFRRTAEGVAIVTVIGELVNRGAWVGASSGLVSYEAIRFQLNAAAADRQTRSIILDLETPGGEAIGAFEAAAAVRAAAAAKPVIAVVDGVAASAGYALASGAGRIVSIPSGMVGSIGVLWVHWDMSAALEDAGIKPTIITAGAQKAAGNPLEPLSPDVRKDMQAQVDHFQKLFLECVAKGRGGRLTADAARKTEARIFSGAEAVRIGLADATGTFEEVLAELTGGAAAQRRAADRVVSAAPAAPPAAQRSIADFVRADVGAPPRPMGIVEFARVEAAVAPSASSSAPPPRPTNLVEMARAEAAAAALPTGTAAPPPRPKTLIELARAEAGQTAGPRAVEHLDLR